MNDSPHRFTLLVVRLVVAASLSFGALSLGASALGRGLPKSVAAYGSALEPDFTSHLYLVDTEYRLTKQINNPDLSPGRCCIAWSPDGRWIAFINQRRLTSPPEIYVTGEFGMPTQHLTLDDGLWKFHPAWSPDGSKIAVVASDGKVYIINFLDSTIRVATYDWNIFTGAADGGLSWSPDASYIVFDKKQYNRMMGRDEYTIYRLNVSDGKMRAISLAENFPHYPSFSPRESRVVYQSRLEGKSDIYTMAEDGSDQRRLTDQPEGGYLPVWSPDGKRIAFIAGHNPQRNIHIIGADGSNSYQVTQGNRRILNINWSSSGQELLYVAYSFEGQPTQGEVYTINVDGSQEQRLTFNTFEEVYPVWQP
jgi:Tol biopolymer transport system component